MIQLAEATAYSSAAAEECGSGRISRMACRTVDSIARTHLAEIDRKIIETLGPRLAG